MSEILPYILVIIGWAQEVPHHGVLLEHRLYASEEACKVDGNEYVQQRKIYAKEFNNARFEYFCVPAPTKTEIESINEKGE